MSNSNFWGVTPTPAQAPQAQPAPAPIPQAVPQAAPYANAPAQPAYAPATQAPGQYSPSPGQAAGRVSLADQFHDVKPSDRDMITPGHYVLQVTEPYDSFLSKKDNRPVHKARFRVFWTQDGKTMGDTSVIWKENKHPDYARGDVKAYMCAVIGVPEPTREQIDAFAQATGRFVGVRVRENDKGFNDYKWYHIEDAGQVAISAGQATAENLDGIFR